MRPAMATASSKVRVKNCSCVYSELWVLGFGLEWPRLELRKTLNPKHGQSFSFRFLMASLCVLIVTHRRVPPHVPTIHKRSTLGVRSSPELVPKKI